jgi:hypothetical protein
VLVKGASPKGQVAVAVVLVEAREAAAPPLVVEGREVVAPIQELQVVHPVRKEAAVEAAGAAAVPALQEVAVVAEQVMAPSITTPRNQIVLHHTNLMPESWDWPLPPCWPAP